jgi:hypothetical protein
MSDRIPADTNHGAAKGQALAGTLYLSGAITVVAGIALGFVLERFLFALVAVGILDCVLAAMFASGRIGPGSRRREETEADDAALADADPSYNPYARED